MRLITARTVDSFAREHADVRELLAQWCAMVEAARWRNADHVRRSSEFKVRPIGEKRLVFNIKGNEYRLICDIRYADDHHNGIVLVQFLGTHAEYNAIDPETVVYKPARP